MFVAKIETVTFVTSLEIEHAVAAASPEYVRMDSSMSRAEPQKGGARQAFLSHSKEVTT